MTVTTLNSTYAAAGNGTLRTFDFNFALLEESHLYVYIITASGSQTLASDYVVNDFGDEGGSITFSEDATPGATEIVYFERNVPITQETDYTPNDPFPAEVHEDALDKLTMIIQDRDSIIDRCITVPIGDTATDLEVEFATERAEKYLWFDEDGNATTTSTLYGDVYSTDEIDALLEDYYTSTEVDNLLDNYYTKSEVDTLLEDYVLEADLIDYYNVVGDWNKQQYFGIATIAGTWNLDNAQAAQWTLSSGVNNLANPTNQHAGAYYMLKVIQADEGSATISWGSDYKFENATDPTIPTASGNVAIIVFISDGTYMYGTPQWLETY